ncbi:Aspartyl protease family protein 2 [Linum perenne]
MATLGSGVTLGSGEYFMDVFIGTPPKHFSLILDTGSDQNGPIYDPRESNSYRNISCHDPRCQLVSSPDPPLTCKGENQSCPYYYWYGDSSNTTGDFALETFTAEFTRVDNVMIGCGHWNRGLFHGAAGLLGLGRGPLSFASQLQSLYGHSFSYCLVDRNSDSNVTRDAFVKRVRKYPVMDDVPVLDPCYNVSGAEKLELPEFKILFADGAVWDFPVENYFIWLQPGEVVCLAILGTPRSALSIIGNYQQQNFHILYDTKRSRIGYAPMKCADV